MFSGSRIALSAIVLTASLAIARAQTQDQDQVNHRPMGQTGQAATPTPSGSPGMDMPKVLPQAQSGGMPMMGGNMRPMMEMMSNMMAQACTGQAGGAGRMPPFAHINGQIAFYKAELQITDAQLPQWNAYADALRVGAKDIQAASTQAMQGAGVTSAIGQMDQRISILSATLEAIKQAEAAGKPLYAMLTDEQKKTADELMAEHFRGM